jgi:hypothetical protein
MLNWREVEAEAVYPQPRIRALSGNRHYSIFARPVGTWHMHLTDVKTDNSGRGIVESCDCATLDDAKRAAEAWEQRAVVLS